MVLVTDPRRLFRPRYAQPSRQSIQQSEKVCCQITSACQPRQDPRDACPCSSPAFSRSPYPQLDETEEANLQADSRVQDIRVLSTLLAQELREEFGDVAEARRRARSSGDTELTGRIQRLKDTQNAASKLLQTMHRAAMFEKSRKENLAVSNLPESGIVSQMRNVREDADLELFEQAMQAAADASYVSSQWHFRPDQNNSLAVAVSNSTSALLDIINNVGARLNAPGAVSSLFAVTLGSTGTRRSLALTEARPSLVESEANLNRTAGTRTKEWRLPCAGCKKVPPGKDLAAPRSHVRACARDALASQASLSFTSLAQDERCQWPRCASKFASILEHSMAACESRLGLIMNPARHMQEHVESINPAVWSRSMMARPVHLSFQDKTL